MNPRFPLDLLLHIATFSELSFSMSCPLYGKRASSRFRPKIAFNEVLSHNSTRLIQPASVLNYFTLANRRVNTVTEHCFIYCQRHLCTTKSSLEHVQQSNACSNTTFRVPNHDKFCIDKRPLSTILKVFVTCRIISSISLSPIINCYFFNKIFNQWWSLSIANI